MTKDAFYSTLSKAIKTIMLDHPSFKLIVGGDFNATVGRDCERDKWAFVDNNHDPDPTSENVLRLLKFCKGTVKYIFGRIRVNFSVCRGVARKN